MEAIKAVPEKREGPKEKPSGIGKSHNCVLMRKKKPKQNLTRKTKCTILERFPGRPFFLIFISGEGRPILFRPRPEQANSVN